MRHGFRPCRTKGASGSMFRNISSPVKFKREDPPQMSSAPAGRKLRAGGWSVAEMFRNIAASAKCGRNAIMIAASAECGRNAIMIAASAKCGRNVIRLLPARSEPPPLQHSFSTDYEDFAAALGVAGEYECVASVGYVQAGAERLCRHRHVQRHQVGLGVSA